MRYLGLAVIVLATLPASAGCGFRFAPVSSTYLYREEGWALPGVTRARAAAAKFDPQLNYLPGAKAYRLMDRDSSPILMFPVQEFALEGVPQRTESFEARATVIQWKAGTRTVAYSYNLNPGNRRLVNGKMVFRGYACVFGLAILDDRGDGVFRVLMLDQFTLGSLPEWAKPKKKS